MCAYGIRNYRLLKKYMLPSCADIMHCFGVKVHMAVFIAL
jgi:hypothetical protein